MSRAVGRWPPLLVLMLLCAAAPARADSPDCERVLLTNYQGIDDDEPPDHDGHLVFYADCRGIVLYAADHWGHPRSLRRATIPAGRLTALLAIAHDEAFWALPRLTHSADDTREGQAWIVSVRSARGLKTVVIPCFLDSKQEYAALHPSGRYSERCALPVSVNEWLDRARTFSTKSGSDWTPPSAMVRFWPIEHDPDFRGSPTTQLPLWIRAALPDSWTPVWSTVTTLPLDARMWRQFHRWERTWKTNPFVLWQGQAFMMVVQVPTNFLMAEPLSTL